jgi:hypothetical protein
MVRIARRIARIRHPVLGKSDHLACSSNTLELVPILSRCLFPFLAESGHKDIPAVASCSRRWTSGHDKYAGYPNQVRGSTVWLKCHLVDDCIYSNTDVLCEYGGGANEKSKTAATEANAGFIGESLYRSHNLLVAKVNCAGGYVN